MYNTCMVIFIPYNTNPYIKKEDMIASLRNAKRISFMPSLTFTALAIIFITILEPTSPRGILFWQIGVILSIVSCLGLYYSMYILHTRFNSYEDEVKRALQKYEPREMILWNSVISQTETGKILKRNYRVICVLFIGGWIFGILSIFA